ncbi:hypothetical protein DFJ73DRAFT_761136 [Zopfochytrium polystomum]|nr:hypothetical protein DFJ73DRAFT_761136 [Zopfochytrium polystomum]
MSWMWFRGELLTYHSESCNCALEVLFGTSGVQIYSPQRKWARKRIYVRTPLSTTGPSVARFPSTQTRADRARGGAERAARCEGRDARHRPVGRVLHQGWTTVNLNERPCGGTSCRSPAWWWRRDDAGGLRRRGLWLSRRCRTRRSRLSAFNLTPATNQADLAIPPTFSYCAPPLQFTVQTALSLDSAQREEHTDRPTSWKLPILLTCHNYWGEKLAPPDIT